MLSDTPSIPRIDRILVDEPPPCYALCKPPLAQRLLSAALIAAVWLYLAGVLALWLLFRFAGDDWWPATLLLFSPRWLYAAPWPILVLIAVLSRRRLLWPLAVAGIVLLGPIAGFCLPWARVACPDGPALRVLSCNIQGREVNALRLMALIDDAKLDVVALQECSGHIQLDWPQDWNIRREGGLLVASRFPLGEKSISHRHHPPSRWPGVNALRCAVETPHGRVDVCCVHLRSPRSGLGQTLDRRTGVNPARREALIAGTRNRRLESEELVAWLGDSETPLIVLGDFNMPTDSAIYRDNWSRCANAFSTAGFGFGYTKLTPLGRVRYGLRIDHILTHSAVKPRRAWLGPDVGSDHLPLLAELVLVDSAAEAYNEARN